MICENSGMNAWNWPSVPFISSPFLCLPSRGSAEWWTNQKNKSEDSIPHWPAHSFRFHGAILLILFYLSMSEKKRNLEDKSVKYSTSWSSQQLRVKMILAQSTTSSFLWRLKEYLRSFYNYQRLQHFKWNNSRK